eukprot:Seg2836.3 transcript_id=Seg2836.3/GoldUCD/mRNA.D3Y31 product="ATP-dependent DNA helicase Q-like 3" protein_id=Seg2836.3/GoldUCD/D3Y31
MCWQEHPSNRPSFDQILDHLNTIIREHRDLEMETDDTVPTAKSEINDQSQEGNTAKIKCVNDINAHSDVPVANLSPGQQRLQSTTNNGEKEIGNPTLTTPMTDRGMDTSSMENRNGCDVNQTMNAIQNATRSTKDLDTIMEDLMDSPDINLIATPVVHRLLGKRKADTAIENSRPTKEAYRCVEKSTEKSPEDEIMRWGGYAKKYFDIDQLREFQIEAISSWSRGSDTLIVQSTSSGKSICFQLPALLQPNKTVLVVIPTTALAEDQVSKMKKHGIDAILVGATSNKESYERLFEGLVPPQVVVMTPEKLFGTDSSMGVLDQVLNMHAKSKAISLVAIDEVHMIHQWGGSFRSAFDRLKDLKDLLPNVPIVALTAMLHPSFEQELVTEVLRDPYVTKGTVNRPNVDIDIAYYPAPMRAEKGGEDWDELALLVKNQVGVETAIIYSPFAHSCDPICAAFLSKGLTAAAYTGKTKTPEEKKIIHENMMNGKIQILVATEAYGLGVNLHFVRYVFHIGIPQNMALWMQEMGKAGRDGNAAKANQ